MFRRIGEYVSLGLFCFVSLSGSCSLIPSIFNAHAANCSGWSGDQGEGEDGVQDLLCMVMETARKVVPTLSLIVTGFAERMAI